MRYFQNKTKSSRSIAGLKAKKNGQSAELLLNITAQHYATSGKALIYKRYEPYKRVSTGKVFKAVYTGKAGADYSIFLPDGRAGMIEVKSRDSDRISISAVSEDQVQQLKKLKEFNQLAYILVRLKTRWFIVDFDQWLRHDRKSHTALQLAQIGKECKITHIINLLEHIN